MKNLSKILFLLFMLAALSFTSCDNDADPDPLKDITVAYKVTNSEDGRTADIEYTPETGREVELKNEALPWLAGFTSRIDLGDVLILTVKGRGGEGIMTAEIMVNGVTVESETDDELIVLVWSGD